MYIRPISINYDNQIKINNLTKNNQKHNNTLVFNGKFYNNVAKSASLILTATALLALSSCSGKQNNNTVDKNNDFNVSDLYIKKQNPRNTYYYFPTSDGYVDPNDYAWLDTTYPDGSIDRDSFNYKIHITPEGYRTEVKTEKDDQGNTCVTTTFPDKSKIEKYEYKPVRQNEIVRVQKSYRFDGTISEIKYYNEYPSDTVDVNSEKIVEESSYSYNDKEVLIKWESNVSDPDRNEKFNKYDRKKRLIYDDVKNEKYYYKGNNNKPYRSTSTIDGCTRVTLYKNNGSIKRIYFKAADGTVTEN